MGVEDWPPVFAIYPCVFEMNWLPTIQFTVSHWVEVLQGQMPSGHVAAADSCGTVTKAINASDAKKSVRNSLAGGWKVRGNAMMFTPVSAILQCVPAFRIRCFG